MNSVFDNTLRVLFYFTFRISENACVLGQNAVFNLPIDKVLLNMYNKGAVQINAEQNHINKFYVTKR